MVYNVLTNQTLLVMLNDNFFIQKTFQANRRKKTLNILILHIVIWSKTQISFLQFNPPG